MCEQHVYPQHWTNEAIRHHLRATDWTLGNIQSKLHNVNLHCNNQVLDNLNEIPLAVFRMTATRANLGKLMQ